VNIFRSDRREKEREARAAGRMPPGQSLTEKFPVLTYESQGDWPTITLNEWQLDVTGQVTHQVSFDFDSLTRNFEVVDLTFDIHCVTRWSKLGTTWRGVRIRDVLEKAGLTSEARYMISHSYTGYSANVPLENAMHPQSLITWQFDGNPISRDHGGPVRDIIDPEHLYFWKSAKFLRGLELVAEDEPGFWERLGYNNRGNIWAEERFWNDGGFETRRDVIRSAQERGL
jgi:DMSO/TMAO reductase YedYZ molybdopterin-dependent catalytic subunit